MGRTPAQAFVPQLDIDDIVNCFKMHTRTARNEEELRIRVSNCIEEKVLKPLGITRYHGKYEYTPISGARVDALYGHELSTRLLESSLQNQISPGLRSRS